MKKLGLACEEYLVLGYFAIYLALMPLVASVNGCKSPPATIAYKAIGVQVVTVEAAKAAVADAYVAGQISEKDFQAIRTASNQYDAAVKVEADAVLAYKAGTDTNGLNRAMIAVSAASGDLMALIFKLLPVDRVARLRGLPSP